MLASGIDALQNLLYPHRVEIMHAESHLAGVGVRSVGLGRHLLAEEFGIGSNRRDRRVQFELGVVGRSS